MPNFVSPWANATDSMEHFLAKQDVDRRATEDRARAQKVQDVNMQIAQENLATNKTLRESQAAENVAQAAKIKTDAAAKTKDEEDIQRLIKVVTDPHADPSLRQQAGLYLDRKGVAPAMLNSILAKPDDAMEPVMRIGRDGKMVQIGTAKKGTHFVNEPAPTADPNEPKPFRDSTTLPEGMKAGIAEYSRKGMSLKDARAALSSGWAASSAAHPHADMKEASAYLTSLYPADQNPVTGAKVTEPLGLKVVEAPKSSADADIAVFLQSHNQPVTPANVAHVKQQMGGGK